MHFNIKMCFYKTPLKILVIKPSSLGDIIHGLTVIATLKNALPDSHITWVVRDIFEPFVRHCTSVNKTLIFERKKGIGGLWKLLQKINKSTYDIVLDLQGLMRSGLMTAFAQAPIKIGRTDAREGAQLFYDIQIPLPDNPNNVHALDILLEFLHFFNINTRTQTPITFSTPHTSPHILTQIPSSYILLFPNSRRREKEWPYFETLTLKLIQTYPHFNFIWAGDEISPLSDALKQSTQFYDLRSTLPIENLPILISKAQLVIANDSGPMHLAAAMKIPILGLFGPTDPHLYGPYPLNYPTNYIMQAPLPQIKTLEASTVFDKIQTLLR